MIRRKQVAAVLALAALLSSCRQTPPEHNLRAQLSAPLVAVAESMERAWDMVDSARYRVDRGRQMQETLLLLRAALDGVRADAGELALAAREISEPEVMAIARQSVSLALAAADDVAVELTALQALADADVLMSQLVASWSASVDQPADQALVAQVQELSQILTRAGPVPPECRVLWDNRVRWSALLVERSAQIADPALREAFLANPFAQDRRAADAADRDCWRAHGALPLALADLEPLLQRFNELTAEPA